jgi:xylose isomerase
MEAGDASGTGFLNTHERRWSTRMLVIADRIISDGRLDDFKASRYASFTREDGQRFEAGKMSLVDLRNIAANNREPELESGKQEWIENLLNDYMFS